MDSAPTSGRARLRFGRFDYAAFLTFASYAASSLAIPVVLVEMAEEMPTRRTKNRQLAERLVNILPNV